MRQLDLDDFSGGFNVSEHSGAFKEGEWSKLDGFVFDGKNLRSQWPIHRLELPADQAIIYAPLANKIIAIDVLTGVSKWRMAAAIDGEDQTNATWNDIPQVDSSETEISATTTLQTNLDGTYFALDHAISVLGTIRGFDPSDLLPTRIGGQSFAREVLIVRDSDGSGGGNHWLFYNDSSFVVNSFEMDSFRLQLGMVGAPPTMTSGFLQDQAHNITQWGDFTVMATTEVPDDDGIRYNTLSLWFSNPASIYDYDLQNYVMLSTSGVKPRVLDMIVLPEGMVVFTPSDVFFLRGSADNFVIETLTTTVDMCLASHNGATFFEPLRAAVWADRVGRVWITDGTSVRRIDTPIRYPYPNSDLFENPVIDDQVDYVGDDYIRQTGTPIYWRIGPSCTSDGERLVVARADEILVFNLVGDSEGVWTRLALPDDLGVANLNLVDVNFSPDGTLYVMVEDFDVDYYVHTTETLGLFEDRTTYGPSKLLQIDTSRITDVERGRYVYYDSGTSAQVESMQDLTVGTPVLASEGHQRTWWRRLGVRLGRCVDSAAQLVGVSQWTTGGDVDNRADGTFEDALVSTDLDDGLKFDTALHTNVVHRKHVIVPGIGPTRVYRAEFVFNGDVTIEGVTVWMDGAALDRGRHPEQAGDAGTYV